MTAGITKRAWLFMLEHGGRWTVAELAEQFGCSTAHMDKIVWSMCKGARVTRYRSGQRKNGSAFGVSLRNVMPQGLRLADVVRATAVRVVIEPPVPASANDGRARERA